MAEIEILPQKIVDTRKVILKSKFDSSKVKIQGEKLKTSFFAKFGFLKPKPKDVLLVAFSKYYEPYIVIGGKYSIDYCKRHDYALKVEDRTQALFIDGKRLKPEPLSGRGNDRVIKLVGEEHSHYENETYVVLDRMLQEVSAENLFLAPSESDLENQQSFGLDLRKPQISLEEEIAILRSRIAKRPADVAEIIRENFEINERTTIYSPFYELTFKNLKNGKKVTAIVNGVTGGVVVGKFEKSSVKLDLESAPASFSTMQTRLFRAELEQPRQRQPQVPDDAYVSSSTSKSPAGNLVVKERVNPVAPKPSQGDGGFQFSAEKTTHLATDFMSRLGYKQGQFPTKLSLDGETNVVEIKLHKGTARMQIDTKTKEVKEYEIQEEEAEEGWFTSKRKILFLLLSIAAIVVLLKLVNIF
jgi:hypothetical protein